MLRSSQGNAPDFGDATISVSQGGATASDTRAIRGGGSHQVIQML